MPTLSADVFRQFGTPKNVIFETGSSSVWSVSFIPPITYFSRLPWYIRCAKLIHKEDL